MRAALLFLPLVILFSLLYLAVKPHYEPAVQWLANQVTTRMSPPTWIDSNDQGRWRCHVTTPSQPDRIVYRWNLSLPHLVLLSLALVPALTLASPTSWRNRLKVTALGLLLVVLGHVFVMGALTRSMWCLSQSPRNFFCLSMLRMLYVSGQLFAVAIWGLLTWRYWFPAEKS